MKHIEIRDHAPRFSTLATCIRAALYGQESADVQYMVQRNINVDSERQVAALGSKQEKKA